jgi:hypothetical protein
MTLPLERITNDLLENYVAKETPSLPYAYFSTLHIAVTVPAD